MLAAHVRYIESPARRSDCFACFPFVGGKLLLLFLQKLRHFLVADTVYIVGGVLAALMKHHNIRNGKAVFLKVLRVVDIETGKNIFKGEVPAVRARYRQARNLPGL